MGFETVQLRLRPTHAQKRMLKRIMTLCCEVYNYLLDRQLEFLLDHGRLMSVIELNAFIPLLKKAHPEYKDVHSRTLQNLSSRVYQSSEGWLARLDRGGLIMPRHKRPSKMRSFAYTAPEDFRVLDNSIHLSKMDPDDSIRFKCNQHIAGEPRTCMIVRQKTTWLCYIGCNVPDKVPTNQPDGHPVVGADLGLITLVTLSDGTSFPRLEPEEDVQKQLKKAQERLSKCEEGTPEYEKWHGRVINKHIRIKNRRRNNTRHVAKYLAENYGIIAIEDIDIMDLIHNEISRGLRRSQYNAGWGELVKSLNQAAKSTGTKIIPVDPFCTSQLCCRCDALVCKDLSVRTHRCWYCGLELDRDLNASLNVLKTAVGCTASVIDRKLQELNPRTIVLQPTD